MAAQAFLYDRNKDITRDLVSALVMIRQGMLKLEATRAVWIQTRDGAGSQAVDYDLIATTGGFLAGDYADANAAAKAAFDEFDTLYNKVGTDGAVSAVRSSINQACAKFGLSQS